MEIKLVREIFTDKSTIGSILVDNRRLCYALEDKDRYLEKDLTKKVKGESAIPAGRYRVIRTLSPRFRKILPRLLGVPGFDGILIHTGNKPEDTEGCILPGMSRKKDWVSDSRKAFDLLDAKIQSAISGGEKVYITIERAKAEG